MIYYFIQIHIFFSIYSIMNISDFCHYNKMLDPADIISQLIFLTILGAHWHAVCFRSILASTFSAVTSYSELQWWGHI